jgi:coenzyme F420-0:L-glutamate ligase/coenzyme F420-1:gamma-L-glutamate ligase
VLIVETRHGLICANAGVDASNVDSVGSVTLLPEDPNASARRIRETIRAQCGAQPAVIVSDSFNRPWRMGSVNVAIGVAGMKPLEDRRGTHDDNGNTLRVTVVGLADEIASAAQLVMGEAGGVPAAIVRGIRYESSDEGSSSTIRPAELDLFR